MPAKMTKNAVPDLDAAVAALTRKRVYVGIPSTNNARDGESISNAALGYIHEHGAPEANIPARPFLVPGLKDVRSSIQAELYKAGQRALSRGLDAVEQGLNRVGLLAVSAVRKRITQGLQPPLAASTIAGRESKGQKAPFKPLIDTGKLLGAITYVVRDR